MSETVILRFRDLLAQTIPEHQSIIRDAGHVWWGWWRKPDEPQRLSELAALKAGVTKKSFEIGLYDRVQTRFYAALLGDCVFSESGDFIKSPDEVKSPEYYRNAKLPAWFKLLKIEELNQAKFVKKFSEVPLGDYTFFPVKGHQAEEGRHAGDAMQLRGNTIVHLSDIHFGDDFGFPAKDGPGAYSLMSILSNDIKKRAGKDVGLLVISGDTTSRGNATHLLTTAKPFLHELRKKLGLESQQVIIVPGNHDISYKDFSLTYDHEAAFKDFLKLFYEAERNPIELLRFTTPAGRSLEILPINSIKLRTKETSNYGWVEWQAYETVLERLPPADANTLRIAVIHHHLAPALKEERLPDDEYPFASVSVALNAAAVIEGLQRHGFRVVLHGHQHTPALNRISRGRYGEDSIDLEGFDEPLYVIASGSTGAKASRIDGDIRDNTYGLLSLGAEGLGLRVRQFNPSGSVRDLYKAQLSL